MRLNAKILLVSEEHPSLDQIKGMLNEYETAESITYQDLKPELDRLGPDLVVLVHSEDDILIDAVEYIHSVNPFTAIVIITHKQDFHLLRSVTRVGVSDFFIFPDEVTLFYGNLESIIRSAVERNRQSIETAVSGQSFKKGKGQIFSFFSGKGGSGRTLVASSFAQALKIESTAQIILIDLNLQYGGTETFLSIESNRSLADLLPVINELNESHIRYVSEREMYSKLEVLLSPRDAEAAELITDDFISRLLRNCRRSYDFVIVDLPVVMNENTYTALEESDKIFYVLNMDTPSISMLKQVSDLLQRLGIDTKERMQLVLNMVGKENEITPKDVKNTVEYPIVSELPRDLKGIQPYINKSQPLRKEQKEKKLIPFSKAMRKWVLEIID